MKINVAQHISELLFHYEKVIVPNLGAFLAVPQPAEIQAHGYIVPPSRTVRFDKMQTADDAVLVNYIAQKQDIPYTEAQNLLHDFVENTLVKAEKNTVKIGQVGRLYFDSEKNIHFVKSNFNFNGDAYGLPTLQFFPLKRPLDAALVAVPIVAPARRSRRHHRYYHRSIAAVAAIWEDKGLRNTLIIIILLIVFVPRIFNFITPNNHVQPSIVEVDTQQQPTQETGEKLTFNPFEEADSPSMADGLPSQVQKRKVNVAPEEVRTPTPPSPVVEMVETPAAKRPSSSSANTRQYIAVVGVFGTTTNADRAVETIKSAGFKPHKTLIYDTSKYRVGVEITCTPNDLDRQMERLRKIYPSAWVSNR